MESLIDGSIYKLTSDEQFTKLLVQLQRYMNETSNSLQYATSIEEQKNDDLGYNLSMTLGLTRVIHIIASSMFSGE